MTAPIRIEFTYTADDYLEGNLGAARLLSKQNAKQSWATYLTFTIAACLGGPAIIYSNSKERSAWILGSGLSVYGILYLSGFLDYLRFRYARYRRMFEQVEILHGPREIIFDDQGQATRGPRYFNQLSWESYDGFTETENLFLLDQPPGLFVMIPKRAFTAEQLSAFRDLIGAKLPVVKPALAQPTRFLKVIVISIVTMLVLYLIIRAMD